MEKKINQEDAAKYLLYPLWRGVDDNYKKQYAKDVWQHFENAIKSASNEISLSRFVETFRKRIPCIVKSDYIENLRYVIECGQDAEIIDWLRTETTYMVMIVRMENEDYKLLKQNP